ncbi:hypothetical protein PWT90_01987 [Aphanocladium album]|nr:hypothetical protein PWT90_01987 [Aphanocladium album]
MRPVTYTIIISSVAGALAGARQAADLPLSAQEYESYGCGSQCQAALQNATQTDLDIAGRDFDFDFYATAANFSTTLAPGRILKLRTLDANSRSVPAGTTVHLVQYTSRDLDGSIVPATAFIAFPQVAAAPFLNNNNNNGTKFPLVAWAHGTIGLFPACAPSNGPALYDYNTWAALARRGYAVVATDYAGLGSSYTAHKYVSHLAHVNDVYYSVQAARSILGDALSEEWMAAGHSQGGGAVWKLAESEFVRNDTTYLGTVALAPATYVVDMLLDSLAEPTASLAGYLPFIPFALERGVSSPPSFEGSSLVGPAMKLRLRLAERAQLCIAGMFSLAADRHGAPLGARSPAPVLVVQGARDSVVLPYVTERAWENACRYGNEVHLRAYEGQEHSPAVEAAAAEWLGWIDARFSAGKAGGTCRKACTKMTRGLMAGDKTKAPPESP